ncbi:M15 family metallopeptidase [Nocardioides pacificus]
MLALALLPLTLLHAPVAASAAEPTTTALSGTSAPADAATTLSVLVATAAGQPLAGVPVTLERRVGGVWQPLGAGLVTDAEGRATTTATLSRAVADNVFRATYPGDATYAPSASGPVQVALVKRASRLTLAGPRRLVDERSATLRVRWVTGAGEPVSGPVRIQTRAGGKWRNRARVRTDAQGHASLSVRPRSDGRWRAVTAGLGWVKGDRSSVLAIDNVPPGEPVALPRNAPRPRRKLPPQPHAVGVGANPTVSRISGKVWRQMTGISWRRGCPVGRAGLRHLRVNYWDYDGYRRRGEMIVAASAADRVARALRGMYDARLPIRSMYRIDRFGYSAKLRGGNDYASMAAGNSSAFNCRNVVNKPGVRSPHSYGRSVDINPWENPYRSRTGLVPNTWWHSRSHSRVAWRSRDHRVVRLMSQHGLRWTYGTGDSHHFDALTSSGRVVRDPRCSGVCH